MQQRSPYQNPIAAAATASPAKRDLLAKLLRGDLEPESATAAAIPRRASNADPRLSFAQERLWFLDQLMPNSPVFNVPMAVRISHPLDLNTLQRTVDEIVRRHEVFRTAFVADEGLPKAIVSPKAAVRIDLVDLNGIAESEREGAADRIVHAEVTRPFNLSQAPLIRTTLIKIGAEESIFILTMHHIVSDGASILIFFRELSALYRAFVKNEPSPLAELPIQYADYALWQRDWLRKSSVSQQLAYWKDKLSGHLPVLDLPTDHARPYIQTHSGARVVRTLSEDVTRSLTALSRREGATVFMTLLAAFQTLLHRVSGQDDIIVGSPISNRPRSETENLIGFFLNNLALRTDLSGDPTFREVLSRVRRTALDAYANQDVPFEKLLEELKPERDLSRPSIFQVYFNLFSFGDRIDLPDGDSISFIDGWLQADETLAKFDLTLYAGAAEREIKLALVYNTDLFSRARMEEMLAQLEHLLAQAVENPDAKIGAFSLVTPQMRRVLPDPKQPFAPREFKSITQQFSDQAQRRPQAVAVSDSRTNLTYAELDARANQLANDLLASGIEKGDVVAVYGHRNANLVTAIVGILKAGAAFTILDPAYPPARLIECLRIAQPRGWIQIDGGGAPHAELQDLIETEIGCRLSVGTGLVPAPAAVGASLVAARVRNARRRAGTSPAPTKRPNVEIAEDDLAYIAFTSGSTGQPKGVMGRHASLTLFTSWAVERFDLDESDRFCMLSGLAHDPLHRDIFTPLQLGGMVCIPDPEVIESPEELRTWMARQEITVANLTPAMGQLLTDGVCAGQLTSLRYSFLVGDALTKRDVARLKRLAPAITCINLYGSTETQRAVGHYAVPNVSILTGAPASSLAPPNNSASESLAPQSGDKEILPLGKGIHDVQLLVLNGGQQLCGVGELGEIYFRSPYLAAGYLGDEELTNLKFTTNPFTNDASDRLYRTGDLGRYLPDGNVEHAGRADRQIKIRGFRIEPAEIEAALTEHPQVREAVVIARSRIGSANEPVLVAYVVPEKRHDVDATILRQSLAAKLPQFMIPSSFVMLAALPLTPNGKLDRAALPIPTDLVNQHPEEYTAPRSDHEKELVELWQEVMSLDHVGVHDNFFDLGGHSLLAVRLFALIEKRFGKRLPLATLFQAPTIAQLVARLNEDSTQWSSLVPIQPAGSRPPFFCVHAVGGNVLEYYDLARYLGSDQPFYGLQSRGLHGEEPHTAIAEMARHYLNEIRNVQPDGPYFIGGRSLGGIIAYEMACQLRAGGEEVSLLALLDSYPVGYDKAIGNGTLRTKSARALRRALAHLSNIHSLSLREKISYITNKSSYGAVRIKSRAWRAVYRAFKRIGRNLPAHLRDVEQFNWLAASRFIPRSYDGRATLFWASQDLRAKFDMIEGWKNLASVLDVVEIPGTHLDIIKEPYVAELAAKLQRSLASAQNSRW
jgi:non-ribosomal peptide synthetase component F/thioesterase domain-containing protein/acyl carrier protein